MSCGNSTCGTSRMRTCCKSLLYLFNFIFALCSLALLLLALELVFNTPYQNMANPDADTPLMLVLLWIIFSLSTFSFLLTFIGCFGAVCESRFHLFSFGAILAVVLIIELIIIGVGYSNRDLMIEQMQQGFYHSVPLYLTHPVSTTFWDAVQTDLECCGMEDPDDWHIAFRNNSLPASCCPLFNSTDPCFINGSASVVGCWQIIYKILQEVNVHVVFYAVAITIGIIEIVVVTLAYYLGYSISNQYRTLAVTHQDRIEMRNVDL